MVAPAPHHRICWLACAAHTPPANRCPHAERRKLSLEGSSYAEAPEVLPLRFHISGSSTRGGAPLARVPAEDISASSSSPRPRGAPTDLRPSMMPPPGTCGLRPLAGALFVLIVRMQSESSGRAAQD